MTYRTCVCGRGEVTWAGLCAECNRTKYEKRRTKDMILTDLARAQNIGDHEGQRKFQNEYKRLKEGADLMSIEKGRITHVNATVDLVGSPPLTPEPLEGSR